MKLVTFLVLIHFFSVSLSWTSKGRNDRRRDRSSSSDSETNEGGPFSDLFTAEEYEILSSKRVRREIRDLSREEWNRIVRALNVMKSVPTSRGRQYFGPQFINYDELVCQHSLTSFDDEFDTAHVGPHFSPWHRAFVLSVENSLLEIDPTIEAIPYWDIYKDIDEQNSLFDLSGSVIFSDQYFGDFFNEQGTITNGRFAYWQVNDDPANLEVYQCGPFFQNTFGFLRQRDNIESNPFVTRYGGSVCGGNTFPIGNIDLYDYCLNNVTDYTAFFYCFNFEIHARQHIMVGGTRQAYEGQEIPSWPCSPWHTTAWTNQVNNVRKWAHLYGCFECPTIGSCDALLTNGASDLEIFNCAMCNLTNGSNICDIEGVEITILNTRENQQIIGDYLEQSTSPNDPIFTFAHAFLDKYLTEWQLRNYEQEPYYNHPTSGFETGAHLQDVVSPDAPFTNLFDPDNTEPLTYTDIWDNTGILTADYVYDTILELTRPSDD